VGRAAAFFDLDRTAVAGSSSTELTVALVDAGLAPARRIPGMGLLGQAYEHLGENLLVIGLARAAALAARGWPVDRVDAAARRGVPLPVPRSTRMPPRAVASSPTTGASNTSLLPRKRTLRPAPATVTATATVSK